MASRKLLVPLLALSLGSLSTLAGAQDLAGLLPEETFFALGMQDLQGASAQLEDFSAEFERLAVGDALMALASSGADTASGGSASGGAGMAMAELSAEDQEALEALGSLEILGQEAWIAVSASSVSPLPALTLVTRVTAEGGEKVQALLEADDTPGVEALEESGFTFFQAPLEGAEPLEGISYALADDLLVLSTNPDELRGVLRRYSGADEPNFLTSQGYESTLGGLESGTFYGFLDYAQIADVVSPYAQNMGFDPLVTRLSQAFATAGSVGSVIALTDEGMTSESFQALNREGGDSALYTLLSATTPATTDVAVPEGALTFTSSAFDFGGWYDYLNELALVVPELGGDLDSLILSFTGLSLRESLVSWAGEQFLTVTTGLAENVEAGVPSDNLLGEQVFMLEASNEAAAQRGLDNLFGSLSQTAAMMTDPQGGGSAPERETETVAGAQVTSFTVMPGTTLSYAVSNGYALIGTSLEAMTRTLEAQGGAQGDLFADAPGGATSLIYSDDQATYSSLAGQMSSSIEMAAGMGGAGGLDFDAVEQASSSVEAFLTFVATRLTTTSGYSETSAEGIRSHSETQVNWQE